MPFWKRRQSVEKEPPPESVLLGKVAFPHLEPEAPARILKVDRASTLPVDAGGLLGDSPHGIPLDPPPHTLRRSLFEQVEKQPRNATLWVLLGWSSPDARNAAIYFQRALDVDPENPVARDGLDWALSEIGPVEALQVEALDLPLQIPGPVVPKVLVAREAMAQPARESRFKARDFRWRTLSRFYQIPFFRNLSIAMAYLLLISAAEIVTVLINPTAGVIFHATIMIALLVQGSVIQQGPFRRYLIILALAPLIRLLSMSLPMATFNIPVMYRYMIVGVPILIAAYFAARSVGLNANRLYFTWKGWPLQLLFSLTGFLLGYCEYYILRPQSLVPSGGWFDIVMGMFILFVFTGFLEEFIFRSLLQVTGIQLFGGTAIWMISILFGILHIGYYSAFDVFFAASVGLMFGYFALKTHSLLGISLAHGITNITLYILLPLMLH